MMPVLKDAIIRKALEAMRTYDPKGEPISESTFRKAMEAARAAIAADQDGDKRLGTSHSPYAYISDEDLAQEVINRPFLAASIFTLEDAAGIIENDDTLPASLSEKKRKAMAMELLDTARESMVDAMTCAGNSALEGAYDKDAMLDAVITSRNTMLPKPPRP